VTCLTVCWAVSPTLAYSTGKERAVPIREANADGGGNYSFWSQRVGHVHATNYTYFDAGNVHTRVDARGVILLVSCPNLG
jgi:hypothetical protein